MALFQPVNSVPYRILSVEFGTFLELRGENTFVMRPMKDSVRQQWYFKPEGVNTYQIANAVANSPERPGILSTRSISNPHPPGGQTYTVSFIKQPETGLASISERWRIYNKDAHFYIVNGIRPNILVLKVEEDGSLGLTKERTFNTEIYFPENHRWKIPEVSPSFKDGQYRVRTLNGLGLHTRSDSKEVFISHQDDEDHRLWAFKSLGGRKSTIKNVALQKFLKLTDRNGEGVVSLTDSDTDTGWNVKANSEYTYMIYAEHTEGNPPQDLALSLKDGKAVLRQMKTAHNRIWLIEPDEDATGSSNQDSLVIVGLNLTGGTYKMQCADESYLTIKKNPWRFCSEKKSSNAQEFKLSGTGNNLEITLRFQDVNYDQKLYFGIDKDYKLVPETSVTNWFLERAEPRDFYYICQTGNNRKVLSRGKNLDSNPFTEAKNSSKNQQWKFIVT